MIRLAEEHANESSFRLQDTESVTVRVGTGEGKQSWTIQKKLLTHHSTFFAAAFNGSFGEAITNTIELDEDDPQAFQLFVQWLYTGKFVVFPCRDCDRDIQFDYAGSVPNFLCVVWALGDKLDCQAFQDQAMLQLLALHEDVYLQSDVLADAYKLTPPGSKLRQFVVDQFLFQIEFGSSEEGGDLTKPGCWNIERLGLEDFNRDALTRMVETGGKFGAPYKDGGHYLLLLDWEIHGSLYLGA
ncbi:MAG: hypothetical protein L6R42_008970 [Xanthoria sp. 1 TBL-2021]|nr:MAG: hypothetical protein L6R42_008970 [Xanthoria sp. 1 TBL-2021]